MICSEKDTSERAPHMMPVVERHDAGGEPDDHPDLLERDADRERRLMAVGDGAQRPPDAGPLKEDREHRHHDRGDDDGGDIDLLQRNKAAERL